MGDVDRSVNSPENAKDLDSVLAQLDARIVGRYVFTTSNNIPADASVFARIHEDEATTSVIAVEEAQRLGLDLDACYTRISIGATTPLDIVGVTAIIAQTLASRGIVCNVIAGFHHNHLFVQENKAGEAKALLAALSEQAQGWLPL